MPARGRLSRIPWQICGVCSTSPADLFGSLSHFGRQYRKPIEAELRKRKNGLKDCEASSNRNCCGVRKRMWRVISQKIVRAGVQNPAYFSRQRSLYGQALSEFRKTASSNGSAHLGLLQFLRRLCSDPLVEDEYQSDRAFYPFITYGINSSTRQP